MRVELVFRRVVGKRLSKDLQLPRKDIRRTLSFSYFIAAAISVFLALYAWVQTLGGQYHFVQRVSL